MHIKKYVVRVKRIMLKVIIALTKQVILKPEAPQGIVIAIGHHHLDMMIFSLKSFVYFSKTNYPVNIIDDGTLTDYDEVKIKKHFKNIKVRRRSDTDKITLKMLKNYPYCLRYRSEKFEWRFFIKLFDAFLIPGYKRTFYMDYDVIFLQKPLEIVNWLNKKTETNMYATEYDYPTHESGFDEWMTIENMFRQAVCKSFPKDFNSGLILLNNKAYSLKRINKVLNYIYSVGLQKSWTPEQYSLGVIVSESGAKNLSDKYWHLTQSFLPPINNNTRCLHFAYNSKNLYYNVAIKLALQNYLFRV